MFWGRPLRQRPVYVAEQDFAAEDVKDPLRLLGKRGYLVSATLEKDVDLEQPCRALIEGTATSLGDPYGSEEEWAELMRKGDMPIQDRNIILRGYRHYFSSTPERSYMHATLPNLRDLREFADVPGLHRGILFRCATPRTWDPETLHHALVETMHIQTILAFDTWQPLGRHDTASSLTWEWLFREFMPYAYDPEFHQWTSPVPYSCYAPPRAFYCDPSGTMLLQPRWKGDTDQMGKRKAIFLFNFDMLGAPVQTFFEDMAAHTPMLQAFSRSRAKGVWEDRLPAHVDFGVRILLIAGRQVLLVALRLLSWIKLPALVCDTFGVDLVGALWLLVLNICGASDEALVTDFCATQAGLRPLRSAVDHVLLSQRKSETLREFNPDHCRRVLRFVRHTWGTLNSYMDWIGFTAAERDVLKMRFVHNEPSRLLYRTPAERPFWTQNPGVFVATPIVSKFKISTPKLPRDTGLIRFASYLIDLRNSYCTEFFDRDGLCNLVERRFAALALMLHKQRCGQIDVTTLCGPRVVSWRDIYSQAENLVAFDGDVALLLEALRLYEALAEALLAWRVTVVRLERALTSLSPRQLCDLLRLRNSLWYASKNVRMAGHLTGLSSNDPNETVLRVRQALKDVQERAFRHFPELLDSEARIRQATVAARKAWAQQRQRDAEVLYEHLRRIEKKSGHRVHLLRPAYSFQQVRKGIDVTADSIGAPPQRPPQNFAKWLMRCWCVDCDEDLMPSPFEDRSDDYVIKPETLAVLTRWADQLERTCSERLCADPTGLLPVRELASYNKRNLEKRRATRLEKRRAPRASDRISAMGIFAERARSFSVPNRTRSGGSRRSTSMPRCRVRVDLTPNDFAEQIWQNREKVRRAVYNASFTRSFRVLANTVETMRQTVGDDIASARSLGGLSGNRLPLTTARRLNEAVKELPRPNPAAFLPRPVPPQRRVMQELDGLALVNQRGRPASHSSHLVMDAGAEWNEGFSNLAESSNVMGWTTIHEPLQVRGAEKYSPYVTDAAKGRPMASDATLMALQKRPLDRLTAADQVAGGGSRPLDTTSRSFQRSLIAARGRSRQTQRKGEEEFRAVVRDLEEWGEHNIRALKAAGLSEVTQVVPPETDKDIDLSLQPWNRIRRRGGREPDDVVPAWMRPATPVEGDGLESDEEPLNTEDERDAILTALVADSEHAVKLAEAESQSERFNTGISSKKLDMTSTMFMPLAVQMMDATTLHDLHRSRVIDNL